MKLLFVMDFLWASTASTFFGNLSKRKFCSQLPTLTHNDHFNNFFFFFLHSTIQMILIFFTDFQTIWRLCGLFLHWFWPHSTMEVTKNHHNHPNLLQWVSIVILWFDLVKKFSFKNVSIFKIGSKNQILYFASFFFFFWNWTKNGYLNKCGIYI